ncbi:MAG TPA: 6-hydroxymethylpterin diphosphokinase MptE-like protein [Syntrophorhabdales bacterium]|nr:6-hydroxymethylpterin diphosphokinase MptE-like protein [Syntrophorhabdales bacterium]
MNQFEKNLEVLKKHRPQLADTILSDGIDEAIVRLANADSGEPTVVFTKSCGEEVRIDRADDPVKCAREITDRLKILRPNQNEKEGLIVLLGFGLGYLAQEVLKHFETGHAMIIYEATPQLFKTALEARELTDVLASEKVEILIGPEVDNFSFLEKYHHHLVNGTWYMVADNPSRRLNEAAYDRFRKKLDDQKRLTLANVGTVVGLGKDFADAFMQNVPNILRKPGVTALKNLFKGRTAIVVAAGPSLEKNLHLLPKAKRSSVIIAVDAALPTLLAAGILPDLLVAIDPLPENVAFYKDNPLLKHVPFVCLTQYTPEIVNIYPGPLFMNMSEQNAVALWLRQYWEDKGSILCFGGSVAHLGFAAAEYLGCSTIALIGLDLSFEEKVHAGEASSLLSEGGPYDLRNGADTILDIFGEKRYTLPSFLSFKTSFENHIKTSTCTVINATEGGLPLVGAANARLSDVIQEHCEGPEQDVAAEIARCAETEVTYNLEGLAQEARRARDKLQEIRRHARQILQYIRKVQNLRKNGREETQEFHEILSRIESLTTKVRHPILNLIAAYHYELELYLKRQAVIEIDEMEDKLERLDAQLERGTTYYSQLLRATGLFVKGLEKLMRNVTQEKGINRILQNEAISQMERLYAAGKAARKAGRVTLALKYFEALRNMDTGKSPPSERGPINSGFVRAHELDLILAELYMRQYRYYEARDLLKGINAQAHGLRAGLVPEVGALLETCNSKICGWEERKSRIGDLVRRAEESCGGSLESGLFYFKVGSYERAAKAYLSAAEERAGGQSPELVAALYGLAHSYLKLKENQKAVDAFANALQIDPENPLIYRDLSLLAIENGNTDSGEMFLSKALELAPWSDELYALLARLYLAGGEGNKAIALYEYGIQLNPQNTNLQRELALLYQELIHEGGAFA